MAEYLDKLTRFTYDLYMPWGFIFSFVIGSCIGSFLNVCIWRLPRGENLSNPGSHCPKCNYEIPIWFNIPIAAWLILGGKCKNCKSEISPRYIIIEAFTGVIYALVTYQASLMRFPVESLLSLYFLTGAFIAIIFIDIKHLIIPNKITWSGIVAAGTLCLLFPYAIILPAEHALAGMSIDQQWLLEKANFLRTSPRALAFGYALTGFAMGYGILWSIVELGKAIFGKQKFKFKEPVKVTLSSIGAQAEDDELYPWDEMFDRPGDELVIEVQEGEWNIKKLKGELIKGTLKIKESGFTLDDKQYELKDIKEITLTSREFTIPREAMGRGDIKMLAMIGAFLGPAGVIFTLILATFIGCISGLIGILCGKLRKGKQVPFGPFLAIGATIWMLYWPQLIRQYYILINKLGDIIGGGS